MISWLVVRPVQVVTNNLREKDRERAYVGKYAFVKVRIVRNGCCMLMYVSVSV